MHTDLLRGALAIDARGVDASLTMVDHQVKELLRDSGIRDPFVGTDSPELTSTLQVAHEARKHRPHDVCVQMRRRLTRMTGIRDILTRLEGLVC